MVSTKALDLRHYRGNFIAVLLATLFLTACGSTSDEPATDESTAKAADAEQEEPSKPIPVEVAQATRGEIYAAYAGTASLEAFDEATVVAKVEGEIEAVLVEEGDIVRAGQVLARLDGDRLRLRLEQARANLAKAEQDYARNVDLHKKGLVAPGAFENLKFEMDSLRAAFNIAQLEYDYATIRAPIDGVVSERMIKVGNTISINTACFHIANLQPLVSYLHIPEREFGKIAAGQPVDVAIDALDSQRFRGVVARISPLVDSATGTFKATIEMDPADHVLKPGMFARMSIIYDARENALLVPRAAVSETELGSTVFIVNENTVERRAVETGFGWHDRLEITDGIEEGDSVVVVGQAGLKDGTAVEIIGIPPADGSGVANSPAQADSVENKTAASDNTSTSS